MQPRSAELLWAAVPELVDSFVEKTAAVAHVVQEAVDGVYTRGDIGYYWHPQQQALALYFRGPTATMSQDISLAKMAADRAVGSHRVHPRLLDFQDVSHEPWVKVAYSPTLRRLGEHLNFFPGTYPGGYPNSPSPLAATLTGGLVGAGLGYGVGYLGEQLMPYTWDRGHLRKTLAMLGGGAGALPGSMWMLSNYRRDKGQLDGSVLTDLPGAKPQFDPQEIDPLKAASDVLEDVVLGQRYVRAVQRFVKKAWNTVGRGYAEAEPATPLDVNINKMGHTLWEIGADPRTAATTMGALYAAQQLPDPRAMPNVATPHQTGLLGMMMGAAGGGLSGYAAGYAAGKALGLLTGMPSDTQNTLRNTGAVLGIVNAVVPRLFH